jgi:cysteine-S-conjugate beta-lyase
MDRTATGETLFGHRVDALTAVALGDKRGAKWADIPTDVLPAWIADSDLPMAEPVVAAIRAAIDRGDLGYPSEDQGPAEAWAVWCSRRHGWTPDVRYASPHGNVVAALSACIDVLTAPGEPVVVPVPAYPPFRLAVADLGRRPVEVSLTLESGHRPTLDLEAIGDALRAGARMVLLCSPHNPTGRCWSGPELEALAEVVLANDGWLISDEVFADITLPGAVHIPTASLAPEVSARTVTLTAASKAFATAGLKYALAVSPDETLHQRMLRRRHTRGATPGILGALAAEAAWLDGDAWLDAALEYLAARRAQVVAAMPRLPEVGCSPPEATYLAWLDLRRTPFASDPAAALLTRARVQLSDGAPFGAPGFTRLNFALPRPVLGEVLDRVAAALELSTQLRKASG